MPDNIEATLRLDKLNQMDVDDKDQLRLLFAAAIKETRARTGKGSVAVIVNQSAEDLYKLVAIRKQKDATLSPGEKIEQIKLDHEIKILVEELDRDGKLGVQKADNLVRANKIYPLGLLTQEQQRKVVESVVLNPASVKDINDAEVIHFALQNGAQDESKLQSWYEILVAWLERVLSWLDVPPETYDNLTPEQLTYLASLLAKLCAHEQVVRDHLADQ